MTTAATQEQTIATMLIGRWEEVGAKIANLAREIPEKSYDTAPFQGVRTPGDVIRHVAFWNQYVADTLRGKPTDESANELPKAKYASKSQMIAAFTRSTGDASAALREQQSAFDAEKAALAESFIEHMCEHYGQLVVYARSAGIVPPASRA
jgi:hypothetical protein